MDRNTTLNRDLNVSGKGQWADWNVNNTEVL